jgi:hypothetical protein
MRLNYDILWFENEPDWFEPNKVPIEKFLLDNGFNPNFIRLNGDENWESTVNLTEIDLILMDLKLKSKKKGNELIKRIRDKDILTDVIFYSQDGEKKVREIMSKEGIDGVYCSGRDNNDFENTTKKVIETTIKKVQDLSNLRGLVIAEVCNLDHKMKDIISKYCNSLDDSGKEKLKEDIKRRIFESIENRKTKIEAINEISELIEHNFFETYAKFRSIKDITGNSVYKEKLKHHHTKLDSFVDEIINLRNSLSHVVEEVDSKGIKILKGKDFVFSHDSCKKIRKDLIKHADNFESINKIILEKNKP